MNPNKFIDRKNPSMSKKWLNFFHLNGLLVAIKFSLPPLPILIVCVKTHSNGNLQYVAGHYDQILFGLSLFNFLVQIFIRKGLKFLINFDPIVTFVQLILFYSPPTFIGSE